MKKVLIDDLACDSLEMKLYLQEKLILEVTELIAERMQKASLKKTDLAKRLRCTKGNITQLLDGSANMTLRTVSDVMWALDSTISVEICPYSFETSVDTEQEYSVSRVISNWCEPEKNQSAQFSLDAQQYNSNKIGLKLAG